jgi:hypothetical protein
MRLKVSHVLALVVIASLSVGLMATPASAKMSAKQKAHIRAKLRKQVKKNPAVIKRKSFLKKASLVNFVLPVTIKLRGADSASNPNEASIDLGASLGQRSISLGGTLPAQVKFHDSYDGGALGNVDLELRPGGALTTTAIPLLWNTQVSDPSTHWWDAPGSPFGGTTSGCGDFKNAGAVADTTPPSVPGGFGSSLEIPSPPAPSVVHGVPVYSPLDTTFASPIGTVDEYPGVDDITNLQSSKIPGDPDNLGGTQTPFPYTAQSTPGGFTQPPSVQDTVLRTGPLTLGVATPGDEVNQSNPADGDGAQGSQNIVIGKSGGQANLFGNIPGKSSSIDVTVSLEGKINSIIRQVDSDFEHLVYTQNWPSAAFQCRQAWTGAVQNYIPDVRLEGDLKISPAITKDGDLRIAKASLSSPSGDSAQVALAACLMPYATYAAQKNSSDTLSVKVPSLASPPSSFSSPNGYPIDEANARPAPTGVNCNDPAVKLVQDAGVTPLTTPNPSLYSTTADGSQVSVAGDLRVIDVEADVIIGDRN